MVQLVLGRISSHCCECLGEVGSEAVLCSDGYGEVPVEVQRKLTKTQHRLTDVEPNSGTELSPHGHKEWRRTKPYSARAQVGMVLSAHDDDGAFPPQSESCRTRYLAHACTGTSKASQLVPTPWTAIECHGLHLSAPTRRASRSHARPCASKQTLWARRRKPAAAT